MRTWDYQENPGISQLKASFTALSHVLDVPCVRLHYLGHPGMFQLTASYTTLSHLPDVPSVPGIIWDILGYPS